MKYTIQVVITTDDGQSETWEIAQLGREHLTPATLGLTLADGKAILKALQVGAPYTGHGLYLLSR